MTSSTSVHLAEGSSRDQSNIEGQYRNKDFDGHNARPTLNMIANATANRKNELQKFDTARNEQDSDHDGKTSTPIITVCIDRAGPETFICTTNFSRNDFDLVLDKIQLFVVTHWCRGRGLRDRKVKQAVKTSSLWFLLSSSILVNGTECDICSK